MKILGYFCVVVSFFSFNCSGDHIEKIMEAHGIVPDVIDKAPSDELSVQFNDNIVDNGNELTPLQVKDEPKVHWNADPDSFYTLIMVDPDAPSRKEPKFREVLHWLVGNIKGVDVTKGDHITAFLGSGPPKGTELHRYIFLAYKQPEKLTFDEPRTSSTSRAHRFNFSTKKFVEKYKLGNPIAGNFYQAQWDEYVDIRNKNITN